MCIPIAVAGLIISAASAAASIYAQNQQVKATNKSNEQQYENTMTAYRGNLQNIEATRGQLQADATNKFNENNAAARAANGTARVAAGEAGVSGLSVDALLRDLSGEAAYDNTNVEENYARQNGSLNVQRENAFNMAASGVNSIKSPAGVDYVGAGLKVAQSGVDYYAQSKRNDTIKRGGVP